MKLWLPWGTDPPAPGLLGPWESGSPHWDLPAAPSLQPGKVRASSVILMVPIMIIKITGG